MLDLMALSNEGNTPTLSKQVLHQFYPETRVWQQTVEGFFNYSDFNQRLLSSGLSAAQVLLLQQRITLLENLLLEDFQTKSAGKSERRPRAVIEW